MSVLTSLSLSVLGVANILFLFTFLLLFHRALLHILQAWLLIHLGSKSAGFNIEDTHLTDSDRIVKLLFLVTIAFV